MGSDQPGSTGTVIAQWSREIVTLEANFRLTVRRVGKVLDEAALERGLPKATGSTTRRKCLNCCTPHEMFMGLEMRP